MIVSTGSAIGGEVTVEAQINPEGLETHYEIKLACETCGPAGDRPSGGQLPASYAPETVSLELTGIQSGSYAFDVLARNAAGEAFISSELTVPQVPPGACPNGCGGTGKQYESETPGWYGGLSNSESEQTVKEYEAKKAREQEEKHAKEREAQQAREREERQAGEVAAKAAEGAALKLRKEEEAAFTSVVSLVSADVVVSGGGISFVKLECLGLASCRGWLTLVRKITATSGGKIKRTHLLTIGEASFSIPAGATSVVKVHLSREGRALLSGARGRLGASLTIDELSSDRNSTLTESLRLLSQSPPAKHKIK